MAATRFDPKDLTTISKLGAALGEVHDCVHAVDQKIIGVDSKVEDVKTDIRILKVQLAMIAAAQGIAVPSERELDDDALPRKIGRKVTSLTPWQASLMIVPAVMSGVGGYHLLEPAVIAFFSALHNALMTIGH